MMQIVYRLQKNLDIKRIYSRFLFESIRYKIFCRRYNIIACYCRYSLLTRKRIQGLSFRKVQKWLNLDGYLEGVVISFLNRASKLADDFAHNQSLVFDLFVVGKYYPKRICAINNKIGYLFMTTNNAFITVNNKHNNQIFQFVLNKRLKTKNQFNFPPPSPSND